MQDENIDDLGIREKIACGVRVLVREGLIPNAGHISFRAPGRDWFWTPRHLHIGLESTGPGDIIACDMNGDAKDSPWEASGERFIYTGIFSRRNDIHAIAHIHPPMATVFSISKQPLRPILMLAAHIGDVPVYEVPEPVESHADGLALADALGNAKAVLMRGHGAVTVGKTVEEACAIAVLLEESARTQLLASQLGPIQTIETKARESVFENAFIHFQEVFWDHHMQQRENTPFLKRNSI